MSRSIRAVTVADLLATSTSVIDDGAGHRRTTSEVLEAGHDLAERLSAAGLAPGDRIAVQMPNSALYVDLLAAAAVGGFVIMSVNSRFADDLAASLIERSGARLVVRSGDDLPPADLTVGADGSRTPPVPDPDAHHIVFTTSGTTNAPKLVAHTQRSIATHAGDVAAGFGLTAASTVLVPLPLCGVFGLTVLWGAIAANATVVLPAGFDAEDTARLVEEHGVTVLHGTDDMFHRMLATDRDLSSIETAGYARFNSALDGIVERCESRGIPLSGLYGMSEVQALFAFRGAADGPVAERWRPAGPLVSPQAHRRVVDGELQLQGPSLFAGYLADGGDCIDRELTAAAYDGPWFRTGDLAVEDGPRSFEYIARMGDAMRLGGFLVAPVEIEARLMELPEVEQAQVVAVDRAGGARPVAFVIPAAGAIVDEQAAIDHCAAGLARFKCPVRVVSVDAFPVTDGPNGVKIQRAGLRRLGAELLGG